MKNTKIAVFGGSFDPPHLGHLYLAQQICKLNLVNQVLFLPAFCQPLKAKRQSTSFEHRAKMLEILIQHDPRFFISHLEAERKGKSYTYDTFQILKKQFPTTQFYFLMGTDCLETLFKWYRAKELVTQLDFIIYPRKNYQPDLNLLTEQFGVDLTKKLNQAIVNFPTIEISSTVLREKIKNGEAILEYTSYEVVEYITQHNLYL